MNETKTPLLLLFTFSIGSANAFCEEPHSNYLKLYGSHAPGCSYSILLLISVDNT